MSAILRNSDANLAVGGGVTCEPGSVFAPCQGHLHAALRLQAALRSNTGAESYNAQADAKDSTARQGGSNYTALWVEWAYTRGNMIWNNEMPRVLTRNGMLKIMRLLPSKEHLHVGFPFPGCAINDAWTFAWLRSYVNNSDVLEHVLSKGAEQLVSSPHWKDTSSNSSYIESQCIETDNSGFPRSCGTSFVPLVVAQLPVVPSKPWHLMAQHRARQAQEYLEEMYGTWISESLFFYNASNDGMAFQVSKIRSSRSLAVHR